MKIKLEKKEFHICDNKFILPVKFFKIIKDNITINRISATLVHESGKSTTINTAMEHTDSKIDFPFKINGSNINNDYQIFLTINLDEISHNDKVVLNFHFENEYESYIIDFKISGLFEKDQITHSSIKRNSNSKRAAFLSIFLILSFILFQYWEINNYIANYSPLSDLFKITPLFVTFLLAYISLQPKLIKTLLLKQIHGVFNYFQFPEFYFGSTTIKILKHSVSIIFIILLLLASIMLNIAFKKIELQQLDESSNRHYYINEKKLNSSVYVYLYDYNKIKIGFERNNDSPFIVGDIEKLSSISEYIQLFQGTYQSSFKDRSFNCYTNDSYSFSEILRRSTDDKHFKQILTLMQNGNSDFVKYNETDNSFSIDTVIMKQAEIKDFEKLFNSIYDDEDRDDSLLCGVEYGNLDFTMKDQFTELNEKIRKNYNEIFTKENIYLTADSIFDYYKKLYEEYVYNKRTGLARYRMKQSIVFHLILTLYKEANHRENVWIDENQIDSFVTDFVTLFQDLNQNSLTNFDDISVELYLRFLLSLEKYQIMESNKIHNCIVGLLKNSTNSYYLIYFRAIIDVKANYDDPRLTFFLKDEVKGYLEFRQDDLKLILNNYPVLNNEIREYINSILFKIN
ncbi:hypothetical protein [Spirochaeta isovalerica]|uniref:Uncharacterized protein n=1 Tax=Spirochaeta isovalerica TaxID=150 RepID=A0A841RFA8_9SPIO|nr:hypothetical protein [Spirochaeta isovalerica]MBB6482286.1 hypothetical protein [Spirochaeta isovalerica]